LYRSKLCSAKLTGQCFAPPPSAGGDQGEEARYRAQELDRFAHSEEFSLEHLATQKFFAIQFFSSLELMSAILQSAKTLGTDRTSRYSMRSSQSQGFPRHHNDSPQKWVYIDWKTCGQSFDAMPHAAYRCPQSCDLLAVANLAESSQVMFTSCTFASLKFELFKNCVCIRSVDWNSLQLMR
jgi:hypothetical protein